MRKDENMAELRFIETVPSPGELVLSKDGGGWRHYLDGRHVECGRTIRILNAPSEARRGRDSRLLVRYEMRVESGVDEFDESEVYAVLYFSNGEERVARREDRFEWIARP